MAARLNKVALSGWRGIPFLEFQLDSGPLTALIGTPGAGKSTIAMLLCNALLPDRRMMDVKFLSGVQDPHRAGVDEIAGRVDPLIGFAYVLLEIHDAQGRRIVAGLHVRVVEGRAEFTCLEWRDLPAAWPLQECLRVIDGDDELYPDLNDLAAALARRGVTLFEMKSIREYGDLLWQAGILPCDYSDQADRSLYAKLIESTFRGGLSKEVAGRIKEYMLPAATRLPDSVDRLQKCADTVLRTKGALGEAERQLNLLQATYGLGKSIVATAAGLLIQRQAKSALDEQTCASAIASQKEAEEAAERAVSEYDSLLEVAQQTKTSIEARFSTELAEFTDKLPRAKADQIDKAGAIQTAESSLRNFQLGRKHWAAALGKDAVAKSFDELDGALNDLLAVNAREAAKAEVELEQKQNEMVRLEAGVADSASAHLAAALNTTSLAEEFEGVSEVDAMALELTLGGLAEGVIGTDISELAKLSDDPAYPHTFWLRTKQPSPEAVHELGDWYAASAPGGFVVASKRRRLVLGRQARERRISELRAECKSIAEGKLAELGRKRSGLDGRRAILLQHKDQIGSYLQDPNKEPMLIDEVALAKETSRLADENYAALNLRAQAINGERETRMTQADAALKKLNEDRESARGRLKTATEAIRMARLGLEAAQIEAQEVAQSLERGAQAVGQAWLWLQREAHAQPQQRKEQYIATQTRTLAELGHALQGESADRLKWLAEANVEDEASLCAIWRPLQEIVSDRISVDSLESADGSDLIAEMSQRRHNLSGQLETDRAQMRTEAKSLYNSIATEIRKQTRRIEKLSAFGEKLQFGNVTGMRIVAHQRDTLLDHLLALSKQLDLFAQNSDRPLDVHLAELFNKTLGTEFTGAQLLDYRTYMDITIEARRFGDWDLASGLSGGESIGGGLAFSLMLARSLALRSGRPTDHAFTPTFVIDEVQRLDAEGQGLIVEFGRTQNIQVLVTALSMERKFPCTMYVMARHNSPTEQVVSRRVLVHPDHG